MFKRNKKLFFRFFVLCVLFFFLLNIQVSIQVKAAEEEMVLMTKDNNYVYTTDVNEPIGIEELIEVIELTAKDNKDTLDLTNRIEAIDVADYVRNVLNMPDAHTRILGEYNLVFRCFDDKGNEKNASIIVNVVDQHAPEFDEGACILYFEFKRYEIGVNTLDYISSKMVVDDNHDYELTKALDPNFDITHALGLNTVDYIVTDKSNNSSTIQIEINIIDEIGPAFSATSTYTKVTATPRPCTLERLLDLYQMSACDLETGDLCTIVCDMDYYTENCDTPGIYLVRLYAEDDAENRTYVNCYVEVYDMEEPVFYVSKTHITINTKVKFNLEEADKLIRMRKLAKSDEFDLSIELDEYTENYQTIGSYPYTVKLSYEDESYTILEFILDVVEEKVNQKENDSNDNSIENKEDNQNANSNQNKEEVKFDFLTRIGLFMKKTGTVLWKIIKWPVMKIFGLEE